MKRAIISDVHGNLEALEAVLTHIGDQNVDQICCLGDIIGYGPNPLECVDRVMDRCAVTILGNHDSAALFDPEGFSSGAEKAIFWTRSQLENPGDDPEGQQRRWDYLCDLPRRFFENGTMFVHGSARNPLNEYVFPEDVFNARKIEKIFALVGHACFQGHTHVPGVFRDSFQFTRPDEMDGKFTVGDEKVMVNVGSVGQPRDGDNRSCYVTVEGEATKGSVITYHRVEYPYQQTAEKIYAIGELDDFLGDRLHKGQ